MEQETYLKAPITEAALDIRVRVPKDLTVGVLEALRDDRYPLLHQRPVKVEFKLTPPPQVGNEPISSTGEVSSTPLGFAYRSADSKMVFQSRTDGYTHNHLAPYSDWKTFSGEARRLWQKYAAVARPEVIELLGLNYVNQILIPDNVPFEKYLHIYITIPTTLPQMVSTYSLSFQITWPGQEGILAFVGQSLGPQVREGFATMILSIQAFKTLMKRADEVDEEQIWRDFETLRGIKNSVFEACISDTVREGIR